MLGDLALDELTDRGFPMVCMDARQAHAALSISINKTDANDAKGLAHLLRTGLYREVRVKSWEDMRKRTLLRVRAIMLRCVLDLANAIRGALRTFGISLPAGSRNGGAKIFERRVIGHLTRRADLEVIIGPLLKAWRAGRAQVARHESAIRRIVREDPRYQLLMTVPGIGFLTAVGYVGAIGDPATFKSGRTAAAWIGLPPRRYQSNAINQQGRISRQGDKLLRSYLYEQPPIS
ncbi:IS110 family RNA-guided transposase [Sedimentitalea nanhaiensis]|uniref:Transposase IS116/IS110/IS902 family protein n=1 Tax=Sedimentitalea nanhaiensis TaxID=999627 RepID=A0A1I7EDF7_9RHOB|nr:IS110 family transposase [Sedimentitalea nanhaiensis]SFU21981.1 Transposase IS116/IS110/IS902 family protein [Sedimentitalea nanhaiensis]